MRRPVLLLSVVVLLAPQPCGAQLPRASDADEAWRAAPLGTPPLEPTRNQQSNRQLAPAGKRIAAPNNGRAENRWRYELYNGRWWYWTPDDRWSFYNGRKWVTSPAQPTTVTRAPSANTRGGEFGQLRGRLPSWAYSNYGGSGFYEPIGKSSAGQAPGGLGVIGGGKPAFGGVGPPGGTAAGTSELGISGSRSGDAGSGVGGGTVGGTSVTGGIGRP